MLNLEILSQCFLAVGSMMVFLWLWSVVRKDVSVVDPWWSIGFLLVSSICFHAQSPTAGKTLLMLLVSCWALRLWLYLLYRGWGEGEDARYTKLRNKYGAERYWWYSLFQVFGLQGVLILIISVPLQVALQNPQPDPLVATDLVGALVVLCGLVFETVADGQMLTFKSNPENRGEVLDSGLWRYSRHPNYFGEFVIWWGFWLFSLDTGWGVYTVYAPLLMSFLLLRVSGVTMLESQLKNSKPAYADYIRRTSSFIPWPPKEER